MKVIGVDLFCGAGGLSYGLKRAGIEMRAGFDHNPHCEYPYRHNCAEDFHLTDITEVQPSDILAYRDPGALFLLAGSPPCQPFSGANSKKDEKDPRKSLALVFLNLALEVRPDFICLENVPPFAKSSECKNFCESLSGAGYWVSKSVVNAADYGVPQYRPRVIVLASLLGPIRTLTPGEVESKRVTVQEAIGNLPPLRAGETCPTDPLHRARALTPLKVRRIQEATSKEALRNHPDPAIRVSPKRYSGVYLRMNPNDVAPTLTCNCYDPDAGQFAHPYQDRGITLREGALLQGFPMDYQFTPPDRVPTLLHTGRLIGNAVPPRLGEVLGLSILRSLQHTPENSPGGE